MAISISSVVLVPDQQKILREEQVVYVDSIVTTSRRCCAHSPSTVSCPTMCDPITRSPGTRVATIHRVVTGQSAVVDA